MPVGKRVPYISILVFLVLCACSPAAPAGSPAVTRSRTPSELTSVAASLTRSPPAASPAVPSRTPTLQPTAAAPLPGRGPYFAFLTGRKNAPILNLVGSDAAGRKEIPLPEDAETGKCFSCVISPDGERLVYWTASTVFPTGPNAELPEMPNRLTLNLLHIPDGSTSIVSELLSPDYAADFMTNAEAVRDLPEFDGLTVPDIAGELYYSFWYGIYSAAWSPDSRYLAFAGEMDGPSSDLYVYDLYDQSIRRLSSGPKNIVSVGDPAVRWSPDGKWIVYTSSYRVDEGTTVSVYAARPDASAFREFPGEVSGVGGWISPSSFVLYNSGNGIGGYGRVLADLESGSTASIWPCPSADWALDPERMEILVYQQYGIPDWPGCGTAGLYLKSLRTGAVRLLTAINCAEDCSESGVLFLGQGERRYLFIRNGVGTHAVAADGKITLIQDADFSPVVSPDRQWVAFSGGGLRLMDAGGEFSDWLDGKTTGTVNWRPDSKGFLFDSNGGLYFVSLPDGSTSRLMDDFASMDPSRSQWQPDSEGYFFTYVSDLYFLSLRRKALDLILHLTDINLFDSAWVARPE
jgi:WD40 repeat protein